jgi:hypothetical protein
MWIANFSTAANQSPITQPMPTKKSEQTTLVSLILSIMYSFLPENQNVSFNPSYLNPQIPLFFYKFSYAYVPVSALCNTLGVRVTESHLSHGN